jgi:hypothetical protein
MKNISFFCLTLDPEHEKLIKELSYIPVGLGNKKFSNNCFTDKKETNISKKNPFYGEYTFHYWVWKNYLTKIKTPWVGFCQYRKFFLKKNINDNKISFDLLRSSIIDQIDEDEMNFDCILGEKFSVENFKFSKIIKHHLSDFLFKPKLFFNKEKRNLKFHFDLFHGKGNLDQAINLLDENNKKQFNNYMTSETSFNPHNMFICRTEILKNYYDIIFPWLEKCENIFDFNNSNEYGLKRIYGFLAERFLSYWFTKNYKIKELPIIGKDLSDYKDL